MAGAVDRRARWPGSSPGSRWRSRPRRSTNRRSSGTRTSSRSRARSRWPVPGGPGRPATRAGGCWPASGRRSRCSATCWASRCCRSSGRCWWRMPGRGRPAPSAGGSCGSGSAGLAIVVLSFLPLAVHELTTDFSEINAALDYIRSGGDPTALGPLVRFLVIGARVVSWPLTGLFTDAALAGLIATAVVIAIVVALARLGTLRGATGGALAGSRAAVDRLGADVHLAEPRDRDPGPAQRPLPRLRRPDGLHARRSRGRGAVARASATGAAPARRPGRPDAAPEARADRAARPGRRGRPRWPSWSPSTSSTSRPPSTPMAASRPPRPPAPGSSPRPAPARRSRFARSPTSSRSRPTPTPSIRAGATVRADTGSGPVASSDGALVVICDSLFEESIGAPCGGPAEATVAPPERFGDPVDRFLAAPGRTISIYRGALASTHPTKRAIGCNVQRAHGRDGPVRRSAVGTRPGWATDGHRPRIANAGAPDAGVRCPETRTVEGESGSCPGVCSVTPRFPARRA